MYDKLGQLLTETETGGTKLEYSYDRFNNRAKMIETDNRGKVTTTTYKYNENNWLEQEQKQGSEVTDTYHYRHDANGNQASRRWERLAPRGYATQQRLGFAKDDFALDVTALELRQYNGFNQLMTVEQDGELTSYSYRPDGLRHNKSSKANTVTHYWDGQNIIAEANANGNLKGKYLRGINLIAQEIGANTFYYIFNAHGDAVQQFGQNGDATPFYHYNAFGNEKNLNQNDPNPFRYCGEYWDKETESYYLRARSYSPRTGRFTREDNVRSFANPYPNKQEIIDPLSLNLYVYCYNNPINYIDPSGHFSIGKGIMGAFTLVAGAVAIAVAIAAAPVVAGLAAVVAGVTFAAGALAVMFGANEVAEGVTGVNHMRGALTGGDPSLDQTYYEAMALTTVAAGAGAQAIAPYAQALSFNQRSKPSQYTTYNRRTIQHEFKHAKDFGITGNWNNDNAMLYEQKIQEHINTVETPFYGTYRSNMNVYHYFDSKTGLNVMVDYVGNYVGSWRLSEEQIASLYRNGNIQ